MNKHVLLLSACAVALTGCASQHATESAAPATAVRVSKVTRTERNDTVKVTGSVVAPDNGSNVAFVVSGKVIKVNPREGDFVRKGDVLAVIDPEDYRIGVDAAVAQANAAKATLEKAESPARPELLAQAKVAYERAADEYARMKRLYEAKAMAPNDFKKYEAGYEAARQQYEQAKNGGQKEDRAAARAAYNQASSGADIARKHLADTTLRAPFDGFISSRMIEPGAVAASGYPVFQIVRLDPVEISVGIPEVDIHRVRAGQKARVEVPALPGKVFEATVRVINIAAEAATRTYMTRLQMPNPKHELRLGMIAEATITGDVKRNALSVPGEAIVRDAQGATQVYVYYPEKRRAYLKRVTTGAMFGTEIEIREGLTGDEQIVVAGQNKLRDASPVQVEN